MHDLVVRAARAVIDGEVVPATVCVDAESVTSVHRGDAPVTATKVIELSSDEVLIPGLVDTHVHLNDPGRTHWEGFRAGTLAAAAGGITCLVDMPVNSIPATTTAQAVSVKRRAAEGSVHVDVGLWGGLTPTRLGNISEMHDAGVFGYKCFLAPTGLDDFEHLSRRDLEQAMAQIAALDGLLLVHAEHPDVLGHAAHTAGRSYEHFVSSRPPEAECEAISVVIDLVERTGCRSHIVHLAAAAALPRIRAAKDAGLPLTVETCPHYLVLSAEDIPDGGTFFKCCPPIRDVQNRELLWQGLGDGTIDFIVSDHSPSTRRLKAADGSFDEAWGGISSLQLSFPLVWTAAQARGFDLPRVVHWMSTEPARFAGLHAKGAIRPGADADLVVLADAERFLVESDRLRSRNPTSPYVDRELRGVVRSAMLRGAEIDTRHPRGVVLRRVRASQ